MNKNFILFDKNNNVQKNAKIIVKFNFDDNDYLVYSIEESEQNSQIFVSRLTKNSEGKVYIDNIRVEDKNKLSEIVYNIVILLPTDVKKGLLFDNLINNLLDKFSVRLSLEISDIDTQEYCSDCSIAITSKVLVDTAIEVYSNSLNTNNDDNSVLVPTWTAPVEVTAPTPVDNINLDNVKENNIDISPVTNQENVILPELEKTIIDQSITHDVINSTINSSDVNVSANLDLNSNSSNIDISKIEENVVSNDSDSALSNPQVEKLAIVSDPSLGIGLQQPNVMKNKKAGFANTKYVVIGTVCLVLAVAVVITAYILISNLK